MDRFLWLGGLDEVEVAATLFSLEETPLTIIPWLVIIVLVAFRVEDNILNLTSRFN